MGGVRVIPASGPLARALSACRHAILGVAAMSAVLNVLMLSGSFFMLLVYDTVLPGHSLPTLVGLGLILALLFAFQGMLDFLRSRILAQIGASVDADVGPAVFDSLGRLALAGPAQGDGLQPVRDLDQIRGFLSGQGPTALIDLPWMVLFLAICFAFHVLIGVTALAGALLLVGVTVLTDRWTREPTRRATTLVSARNALAAASRNNAEAVAALGLQGRLRDQWAAISDSALASQQEASGVTNGMGVLTRTLRMALQSLVLAVGAWLVLEDRASGGVIIASSILSARALAPVEIAIANWRGFVAARQSWARLTALLTAQVSTEGMTALPAPTRNLILEGVCVAPPGAQRLTVMDIGFRLEAGAGLGIVGPSGSGKSCLVRSLVNVWRPVRGFVRLDGATLDQWDPERLGRSLGYLPQDVEMLNGTVAQNIARFDPDAPHEAIIDAAMKANVHDLIVRLPEGYDTPIGEHGAQLSAGQRQRVALARALYGDPFLVVLDEPNSNLDADGEAALIGAMQGVRDRGGIVVVVAHRPAVLDAVDHLMVIREGRSQIFGPRDEVLAKITPPRVQAPPQGRPLEELGRP